MVWNFDVSFACPNIILIIPSDALRKRSLSSPLHRLRSLRIFQIALQLIDEFQMPVVVGAPRPDRAVKIKSTPIVHAGHVRAIRCRQMQQLHDEELEMLRGEQTLRENELLLRIQELEERVARSEELELRVQQLENENSAMERNYKMHFVDLEDDELSIDNIDIIIAAEKDFPDDDNHAHLKEILQSFEK